MPFYPVLPALVFLLRTCVYGVRLQAKLYAVIWFVFGLIIYSAYGIRHSSLAKKDGQNVKNETEAGEDKEMFY